MNTFVGTSYVKLLFYFDPCQEGLKSLIPYSPRKIVPVTFVSKGRTSKRQKESSTTPDQSTCDTPEQTVGTCNRTSARRGVSVRTVGRRHVEYPDTPKRVGRGGSEEGTHLSHERPRDDTRRDRRPAS